MRPNMCTPHSLQACRRIVAEGSTMCNLEPLAVTATFETGMTAMMEKSALGGFQHCEHPQAWLWSTLLLRVTSILFAAQRQCNFPPAKVELPFVNPLSIIG